jgi:hypothetical protein
MPPFTKRTEGTPHSRRVEYVSEKLRRKVRYAEVVPFTQHVLEEGRSRDMRLPDGKNFSNTIRRLYKRQAGAHGWCLDLVELGLDTWVPVKTPPEPEPEEVELDIPEPVEVGVIYSLPKTPADLKFLMDAIPKLDAMTEQERRAAINYIQNRYMLYPGRGMADAAS